MKDRDPGTLGKNIRGIRKYRKLSAEKLGGLIGVSSSAIYIWETGAGYPQYDNLKKLARALDVSIFTLQQDFGNDVDYKYIVEEEDLDNRFLEDSLSAELTDRYQIPNVDQNMHKLLDSYIRLNDTGKSEAVNRVEELTQIKKYTE